MQAVDAFQRCKREDRQCIRRSWQPSLAVTKGLAWQDACRLVERGVLVLIIFAFAASFLEIWEEDLV